MRHGGHYLGRQAHQALDRGGQFHRAGLARFQGVARFIVLHLGHDGTGRVVARRKFVHVALQVRLDLLFGLHHKTQAHAVAQPACQQPQAECPGIPQGIEQRPSGTQFVQPLLGPGQVVGFLGAGALEVLAQAAIAGGKRL